LQIKKSGKIRIFSKKEGFMAHLENEKLRYHKGDNKSGGGGSRGGGGKNSPPVEQYEKGDLKRNDHRDFDELKAKPGNSSKILMEKRKSSNEKGK
jgi:hypothetical protein